MTRRLLAALAMTTALGGAWAAQAETVKIGLLAPLTGPAAADGEEFVRGVEWAIEEANAKGGVAGYTLSLRSPMCVISRPPMSPALPSG